MKYKVGDLVWDNVFNEFGIIIEIYSTGYVPSYRIRWTTGNISESREYEMDISPHPVKNLLVTEKIPF